MDAEIKKKWLDAMKSGDYKFGRGLLRETNPVTGETCHCALGVLAEVIGLEISSDGYSVMGISLPDNQHASLGFEPLMDVLGDRHSVFDVYRANDRFENDTYNDVINYIEKNL